MSIHKEQLPEFNPPTKRPVPKSLADYVARYTNPDTDPDQAEGSIRKVARRLDYHNSARFLIFIGNEKARREPNEELRGLAREVLARTVVRWLVLHEGNTLHHTEPDPDVVDAFALVVAFYAADPTHSALLDRECKNVRDFLINCLRAPDKKGPDQIKADAQKALVTCGFWDLIWSDYIPWLIPRLYAVVQQEMYSCLSGTVPEGWGTEDLTWEDWGWLPFDHQVKMAVPKTWPTGLHGSLRRRLEDPATAAKISADLMQIRCVAGTITYLHAADCEAAVTLLKMAERFDAWRHLFLHRCRHE